MSSRAPRVRASDGVAQRSRTGCQTCRARKLKCDEQRPVCGQCSKSRRECIRSEGVTFRHQQNAALNVEENDKPLGNFYKYRNQFTAEQLRNFVPIPDNLQFVVVHDPFDEEQNGSINLEQDTTISDAYQQVAAHTLEALSTAAADHPPYVSQTSYGDYTTLYPSTGANVGYGPVRQDLGHGHQNNQTSFMLNASGTPSAMIDPNLDIPIRDSVDEDHDDKAIIDIEDEHQETEDESQLSGMSDSKVASVLKKFAESQGQG